LSFSRTWEERKDRLELLRRGLPHETRIVSLSEVHQYSRASFRTVFKEMKRAGKLPALSIL
jgi:hypothetical protein